MHRTRERKTEYTYTWRDGEDGGWVCTHSNYPTLESIGLTKQEARVYLNEAILAHQAPKE